MSRFETARDNALSRVLSFKRAVKWLGYCCHHELGKQKAPKEAHQAVTELGLHVRLSTNKRLKPRLSMATVRLQTREYLNELPEYHAMLELVYGHDRLQLKLRANELARASLQRQLVVLPKASAIPGIMADTRRVKKDAEHKNMAKLLDILTDRQKAALLDLLA